MSLPPSSKYLQRSGDPVDEAERDAMTARLNTAFADGRLSHDDYAAAMETLYRARTLGELVPVVEHLPAPAADVPAIVAQPGPAAGEVNPARTIRPAAVLVGAVGVALLVALALLLIVLL